MQTLWLNEVLQLELLLDCSKLLLKRVIADMQRPLQLDRWMRCFVVSVTASMWWHEALNGLLLSLFLVTLWIRKVQATQHMYLQACHSSVSDYIDILRVESMPWVFVQSACMLLLHTCK